jgi:hypothetical protein
MPRARPVESHARRYKHNYKFSSRCHGLVPWSLTLAAKLSLTRFQTEGLAVHLIKRCRASSSERDAPRGKPEASSEILWLLSGSSERDAPRDKPVASSEILWPLSGSGKRQAPRDKPVASS